MAFEIGHLSSANVAIIAAKSGRPRELTRG